MAKFVLLAVPNHLSFFHVLGHGFWEDFRHSLPRDRGKLVQLTGPNFPRCV